MLMSRIQTHSWLSSAFRTLLTSLFVAIFAFGFTSESSAEQLRIESSPRRAKLYVNGVYKGRTPIMLVLDAGKYHLELRRSRYLTWATYTYLPARTKMRLRVKLEKFNGRNSFARRQPTNNDRIDSPAPRDPNRLGQPQTGGGGLVIIRTKPSGAQVYRGGRLLGRTPILATLPPGEHTLRFIKKGYATLTRTIDVSAKKNTKVKVNLVKGTSTVVKPREASRMGVTSDGGTTQLVITSRPGSALVFLNGRSLGRTPVLTAGLTPGKYKLTLKKKGYSPYSRTFEMQSGQQLRFRVLLIKKK